MDDIKQKLKEFRSNKAKESRENNVFQTKQLSPTASASSSTVRTSANQPVAAESSFQARQRTNNNNNSNSNEDSVTEEPTTKFTDRLQQILIQLLIWLVCFGVALKFEFGIVYTIASAFYVLWKSLGRRKSNEMSAYSVFNPNCERLLGQLTAEQFENELRHRQPTT